jgi:hypothetical protein
MGDADIQTKAKKCLKARAFCRAFKNPKKLVKYPECNCEECSKEKAKYGFLTAVCDECGHELISAGKKGKRSKLWRHKNSRIHLIGKPTKSGLQMFKFECACGCVIERPKP